VEAEKDVPDIDLHMQKRSTELPEANDDDDDDIK
jgi:hypothetical protein